MRITKKLLFQLSNQTFQISSSSSLKIQQQERQQIKNKNKKPIPLSLLIKSNHQLELPPILNSNSQKNHQIQNHKKNFITSTQIIQKLIHHSKKSNQISNSSSSSTPWPINLRIIDGWTGRGRWGEGKPDVKEWIGVDKKHKDLVREDWLYIFF
ncbi:hypothetical protein CROQUDRAFT_41438 [Cronartium quercuum f. sp. fusiforme G11]|uniref:Uncharacterized protein n=1 Tax=Cronartium quercuum f. sp. fusiforme G11 TaxID=708437 RepID=A0A9P6NLW5_9BASI|nr:hypothetical protein CROQUDRAFT_41438 [Cronartium quercuum f. sp. fusiforme G11]